MSVTTGFITTQLASGDRFYAYSGIVQGDVSVPATVKLIDIPNIGLRDTFVKITPFFGDLVSGAATAILGIQILIDGIEVLESQTQQGYLDQTRPWELFVPRGSKFEVISLNTAGNNTQDRGVTVLGWYL